MSRSVRAWLNLLVACLAAWIAAFSARMIVGPDVVPVEFAGRPQALWNLAFLLRAVELIAGFAVILLVIAGLGKLAALRPGTPK